MDLKLDDDELRDLLMLLHLGEWVVNADRRGEDEDLRYRGVLNRVCEVVAASDLPDRVELVEQSPDDGRWYPTPELEAAAAPLLGAYDNNTFWDELIARLAERDLVARHGEIQVAALDDEQRELMLAPLKEAYHAEFYANGLDSIEISNRNLN